MYIYIWAMSRENLSSGFLKNEIQTSLLSYRDYVEIVVSLDMILSKKRITKALIRLRGCAGWSAPLLIANRQRQVFSRRGPYCTNLKVYQMTISIVLAQP